MRPTKRRNLASLPLRRFNTDVRLMMNGLLKEKIDISRWTWFVVASIVFLFLARTIVCQKGETIRIYDGWLFLFRNWKRVALPDLAAITAFTGGILLLAGIAGWFTATAVGIARMMLRRHRKVEPTSPCDVATRAAQEK